MCYRGVFDMSMNVDGFDDLFATLSSLGSVGDKVGKKALRAGLKLVVKQMKIDAPKGDGSLGIPTKVNDGYKKLKVLNVKRFKNGTFIGYAGINSKNFEETKHLLFHHYAYGNKGLNFTGQPINMHVGWMTKSYEKSKKNAQNELERVVVEELDSILKG